MAGRRASRADQSAGFSVQELHQPLAATSSPGKSWQGRHSPASAWVKRQLIQFCSSSTICLRRVVLVFQRDGGGVGGFIHMRKRLPALGWRGGCAAVRLAALSSGIVAKSPNRVLTALRRPWFIDRSDMACPHWLYDCFGAASGCELIGPGSGHQISVSEVVNAFAVPSGRSCRSGCAA